MQASSGAGSIGPRRVCSLAGDYRGPWSLLRAGVAWLALSGCDCAQASLGWGWSLGRDLAGSLAVPLAGLRGYLCGIVQWHDDMHCSVVGPQTTVPGQHHGCWGQALLLVWLRWWALCFPPSLHLLWKSLGCTTLAMLEWHLNRIGPLVLEVAKNMTGNQRPSITQYVLSRVCFLTCTFFKITAELTDLYHISI